MASPREATREDQEYKMPSRLSQMNISAVAMHAQILHVYVLLLLFGQVSALPLDRRQFVTAAVSSSAAGTAVLTAETFFPPQPSLAIEPNGLASRLIQRDPSLLRNKVFNIPPGPQVYPEWMRGTWHFESKFSGYLFPSQKISRDRLTQDFVIPGFQKCSIAMTSDVGKDKVQYVMKIDPQTGLEDRVSNFKASIDAYLGYPAVNEVVYDARKNPNRIGIDFNDYRTINAERIELFCNGRDSEEYESNNGTPIFVNAEFARQVTFGTGSTYGVPRQVGTNYGLFWTWKRIGEDQLQGNLLTAG